MVPTTTGTEYRKWAN